MIPNNLNDLWSNNLNIHSENLAISTPNCTWTYHELDSQSNRVARILQSHGVQHSDVVAIFHSKELISYAAMLACLKLGAIYANIDPSSPPDRLKKIVDKCKPKLLVSDCALPESISKLLDDCNFAFFNLNSQNLQSASQKPIESSVPLTWHTPAYIMFTSGSTGVPKGAVITHGGLLSLIAWSVAHFNFSASDRFVQASPMYFDNSVFDFYSALFSGACLIPVREDLIKSPAALIDYLSLQTCTVWFSVPSLWVYLLSMKALSRECLQHLRLICFGGEGFPKNQLKKLFQIFGNRSRFVNVYGPTECTCICSAYDVTESDFEDMGTLAPLGTINQNFGYLIVDESGERVPPGEQGELCLSGPNVGLGYYNDPDRTRLHFIQHPEVSAYREIVYKTGDLVFERDGLIWFAGRVDNQIKHLGYRVELEEIECAFHSLDSVQQACAVYHRAREQHGYITAFVQLKSQTDTHEISEKLKDLIPYYMIPNNIYVMEELPKNANGKVDRRKLLELLEERPK